MDIRGLSAASRRVDHASRTVDDLGVLEVALEFDVVGEQQPGSTLLGESHDMRVVGPAQSAFLKLAGFGFDIVVGYPDNAPAPLRRLHPPEEIARPREFSKKRTSHHEPSFALRQPIEHQLSCPGLGRAKDLVPNIIVNDCTHGCLPAKGDNRFAVDSLGTGPFKGQLSAGSPP